MSNLITRDDLGFIEAAYCPQQYLGLSLFGYRFRLLVSRSRRQKMTGTRIAMILLHHESAWERRAVKGVLASLLNAFSPEEPPMIDLFSAEYSKVRLEEEIMPAIAQRKSEYIAVITCGSWVSTQVQEIITQRSMGITQLFLGVPHPVRTGLIRSFEIPQEGIVGVNTAPLNYELCVESLKTLLPQVQTVLIPTDLAFAGAGSELDKKYLLRALEKNGLTGRMLAINSDEDLVSQIGGHLGGVDVLWSLCEPGLQINARKISKMCEEYSVVFCASDLASVFQGADIGWGDSGSLSGAYAGQICFALAMGVPAIEIKNVEAVTQQTMRTNPAFFERMEMEEKSRVLVENIVPLGWE